MFSLNQTFEMNGKTFQTDTETLNLLRQVVPCAKIKNDTSAVQAIMFLGLQNYRIREISNRNTSNAKPIT